MNEQLREFKGNKSSLTSLRCGCLLALDRLKSLPATCIRKPGRSNKRNVAPSCQGPALRSVPRRQAGASLHVSLWALICLRSRSLSADSHPGRGHICSFSFSFFFLSALYVAHSALHGRHSNVPRRLLSARHWCHVAELSRQHGSQRGRSFTGFGFAIIKNNNAGSISSSSSSSTQVFVQPCKHPESTLRARAHGHSSNTNDKKAKADQSWDSLGTFLPPCERNMRCQPCVGSSARISVHVRSKTPQIKVLRVLQCL